MPKSLGILCSWCDCMNVLILWKFIGMYTNAFFWFMHLWCMHFSKCTFCEKKLQKLSFLKFRCLSSLLLASTQVFGIFIYLFFCIGLLSRFLCGSDSKEFACNAGDPGSIPWVGRSPGEGNGSPLQYSCMGGEVKSERVEISDLFKDVIHFLSPDCLQDEWSPQCLLYSAFQFSSGQLLSLVWLFGTPWTAARQTCLSITNSQSLLKLTSIELVMLSNHLILCCSLLLLPSILPSIRVFSNKLALLIRWPKYWSFSFSISTSNEYSGWISFRMDWLDLLAVQGTLKSLLQHHSLKASILRHSAFFTVQLSHPYMTSGKTIALTRQTFVSNVSTF